MTPKEALQQIVKFQSKIKKMTREAAEIAAVDVGADVQKMSSLYKFTSTHMAGWNVNGIPRGAELRNDVSYAIVLETGRRPGAKQPPAYLLMKWVGAKFGIPPGRRRKRAAYMLAKKIKLRGSPAKATLFGNYSRWEQQAQNVFARELESLVKLELP